MNVVYYNSINGKRINGSLFYSFEYFLFLKQHLSSLKFLISNVSDIELDTIKSIFKEKYTFDQIVLSDILPVTRTELLGLEIDNILILNIESYFIIKDFLSKVKNVRVYSNRPHEYLDNKPNHVFYGYYQYQPCHKTTRLKFFKDRHKTFQTKGNAVFLSHLNGDKNFIIDKLKLDRDNILVKEFNNHHENLFAQINKIVYYHTGNLDPNNRIVVESFIHDIPFEAHLNGYINDSVFERLDTVKNNGLEELNLNDDDIIVQDFINGCSSIC